MKTYKFEDLDQRYQEMTGFIRAECIVATEIVGGQPADEKGVRGFVQHHLELEGDDAESAVQRILKEEVGESDVPSEEGELVEKKIYGVNAVRRTPLGPYLGNWMLKACWKQAASRLGVFTDLRGSKGDFAEAARVYSSGCSAIEESNPERIYLINGNGSGPAETYWREFMGSVSSPKGRKSIIHHSECIAPGSRFSFELRFLATRVNDDDIRDVLAMMMIVGLGSARSLERGKFRIETCEIDATPKIPKRESPAKIKKETLSRAVGAD